MQDSTETPAVEQARLTALDSLRALKALQTYSLSQLTALTREGANQETKRWQQVIWKLMPDPKGSIVRAEEVDPAMTLLIHSTAQFCIKKFELFLIETKGLTDEERLKLLPSVLEKSRPAASGGTVSGDN